MTEFLPSSGLPDSSTVPDRTIRTLAELVWAWYPLRGKRLTKPRLIISKMQKDDLPFLLELWHNPEVMRYANEFPGLRGWSKSDNPQSAWQKYQERRAEPGSDYTQMILHLEDGTRIGESFFAPLPPNFTFGKWRKPDKVSCLVGDIKLLPQYWGRGLGTQGMRQIAQFVFTKTTCQFFVVPPNRRNPAAMRVYEKAGFVLFTGMRSWRNHKIMELSRERFQEIYEKRGNR